MGIIAISGKKTSGKDTVGKIIQYLTRPMGEVYPFDNKLNYSFLSEWEIKKFADKLKDMVCILIGCTREQLEDEYFKNTPLGKEWNHEGGTTSPRLILQLLGTECGRQIIHPNIWVNSLMTDYETESKWIITDCRFPNEAEVIKEKGGIIIRVNSKRCNNNDMHQSEIALDHYEHFDYVIDNDSTIDDLINIVKDILIKENILA